MLLALALLVLTAWYARRAPARCFAVTLAVWPWLENRVWVDLGPGVPDPTFIVIAIVGMTIGFAAAAATGIHEISRPRVADWAAAAFVGAVAIALWAHAGGAGVRKPVMILAVPAVLYLLARQAIRTAADVRILLVSTALSGVALAGYAILEWSTETIWLPMRPDDPLFSEPAYLRRRTQELWFLRGVLGRPEAFAQVMLCVAPMLILLRSRTASPSARLMLGAGGALCAVVVAIALNRTAWVILAVQLAVLAVWLPLWRDRLRRYAVAAFMLAVLSWATFATGTAFERRVFYRLESLHGRLPRWSAGVELWKSSPWVGVGFESVSARLHEFDRSDTLPENASVESQYLYVLAGGGLLSFVPYLVFLCAPALAAARRARHVDVNLDRPLLLVYGASLLVLVLASTTAVRAHPFVPSLVFALAAATAARARADPGPSSASGARGRLAYLMQSYPEVTLSFVRREIDALRARGVEIATFALWRPKLEHIPPDEERVTLETVYILPRSLGAIVVENALAVATRPHRYVDGIWMVLAARAVGSNDRLRSLRHLVAAATIVRTLRARGIGHVHAHTASSAASVAMFASVFDPGLTYSFTAHAYGLYASAVMLPEKTRGARFVIAISEYNRAALRAYDRDTPVHVVRIGVDTTLLAPDGAAADSNLVVSVGRLVEKKGHDTLVRACALLAARGLELRCLIVGDGPERGPLEQLVGRLGLERHVELCGQRWGDETLRLLRRAAVFALPCRVAANGDRDGIPTVLVEAMALEVPCVSTAVSGIPELVTDEVNGLLVPSDDPSALAAAIERLLSDAALRARLGQAARARVIADFEIAASADFLERIFRAEGVLEGDEPGQEASR